MSKYYTSEDVVPPTEAQMLEKREIIHADHLDYFYGDHWNIFIDKSNKSFLEFDIGHLASNFIVREISRQDYDLLKTDTSLFSTVSRKLS
jgi:hypothetical protein